MIVEMKVDPQTFEKYQQLKQHFNCEDGAMLELLVNNFIATKMNQASTHNVKYAFTRPITTQLGLATQEVVRLFHT